MNEELKAIFGDAIKVKGKSVPMAHLRYKGKEKTFGTWTITGEKPVLSADDSPLYRVASVDVDVFSNGNYLAFVNEIKQLMKQYDWVWVWDSPEMYEDDTELYHKTISFEKERTL